MSHSIMKLPPELDTI